MEYNNAVLNSQSIQGLIDHLKGKDDISLEDLQLFFERAKYHDDVRVILMYKYTFEYLEKISLGRIKTTIQDLLDMLQSLEDGEICNEIQYFDEEFIKYIVKQDFSKYDSIFGNLSKSLVGVAKDYYTHSFII